MPWGDRRPNGSFRPAWREHGKTVYAKAETYLTKREAEAAAWRHYEAFIAREAQRATEVAERPQITWSAWKVTWLARRVKRVSVNTTGPDAGRIRKWIEPKWGDILLVDITTGKVRQWVEALIDLDLSPGSLAKIYHLFSASLRDAVRAELIATNPCRDIELPDPAPGHERWFTVAEIDAIAGWLNHPYDYAVLLLTETGLRFGELAGLHWQRVDLEHHCLHIVETWSADKHLLTLHPKGRKIRTVPLSDRAMEILQRLPRYPGKCGQKHLAGGVECRSTLVLPGPHGAPLDHRNVLRREFRKGLMLAEIAGGGRQHDLRHTFASWMIQDGGMSLSDLAEILGHADSYVTKRYAHMANKHLVRVRDAMNRARRDAGAPMECTQGPSESTEDDPAK